jgi:hypothetical protein
MGKRQLPGSSHFENMHLKSALRSSTHVTATQPQEKSQQLMATSGTVYVNFVLVSSLGSRLDHESVQGQPRRKDDVPQAFASWPDQMITSVNRMHPRFLDYGAELGADLPAMHIQTRILAFCGL